MGRLSRESQIWVWSLVGAGMLWLGSAGVAPSGSIAAPATVISTFATSLQVASQPQKSLPPAIANQVRNDLSRRTDIPPGKLKLVEATPKTWGDGCLGMARQGEMCTQAMVSGWRVVMTDGRQRWVYRTDAQGRSMRLEGAR